MSPQHRSTSPQTAMAIVILNHLGGNCEVSVLPLLIGISGMDFSKCIQEIDDLGLLKQDPISIISIVPQVQQPQRVLEQALFASTFFAENSVASALYSYYTEDYRKFLEQAAAAIKILDEKDKPLALHRAYDVLTSNILKMRIPIHDKVFCFHFIDKCMNIQRKIIKYPSNSRNQILLFHKIKGIAFYIGDKRSTGYINICMGSMSQTARSISKSKLYYSNMRAGKDTILSLGDKDIILRASSFIIFYYLLEADFNEGINFAYSMLLSEDESSDVFLNTALYSYASVCATSIGNYELARSILKLGIEKILQSNKTANTKTLKGLLSYIFILQGQTEKALILFDELLGGHDWPVVNDREILNLSNWSITTYADLLASRALAFYYYVQGDLEKSYACFKNLLHGNNDKDLSHRNYQAAPFVLELLGAYYIAGYSSPRKLNIHEELTYAMASPSRLVQAVAHCVTGQIYAHDNGWGDKRVRVHLEKSLSLFRTFSAPPDMAKVLLALARMHHALGESEQAQETALEAWKICRHYGQPVWPSDMDNYLPSTVVAEVFPQIRPFDLSIQLLRNLRSQSAYNTGNNFLRSILGSLLSTFEALSGCIFRAEGRSLKMDLSLNIPSAVGEDYQTSLWVKYANKAFRERSSFIITDLPRESNCNLSPLANNGSPDKLHFMITIFVDALDCGTYIFCFLSSGHGRIVNSITDHFINFVENYLSAQICINMSQNAAWQNYLESSVKIGDYSREDTSIIFMSKAMEDIVDRVDHIAKKDTTVLILGESGVGKELIAKRLHSKSLREGEFVSVNLSNIPYELFESECFGHEKGSFTGANRQKKGIFELADGGTLFIDEIGDLPLLMQIKLLRVIQDKQFMRVGGAKPLHSDFRLITATNRDLEREIQRGRFREDLYYRLNVVSVRVPPLREREDDIIFLADYFLKYYCGRYQLPLKHFSSETRQKILNHPWPGNVRELKNLVERYCVLSDDDNLFPQIQIYPQTQNEISSSIEVGYGTFEKQLSLQDLNDSYFEYIYTVTNGTVGGDNGIASILGISRTTAYSWIERLNLKNKYNLVLRKSTP